MVTDPLVVAEGLSGVGVLPTLGALVTLMLVGGGVLAVGCGMLPAGAGVFTVGCGVLAMGDRVSVVGCGVVVVGCGVLTTADVTMADGVLAVGCGGLTFGGGVVAVGCGVVIVGGGVVTVGGGVLTVGGGVLTVGEDVVTVGGGVLTVGCGVAGRGVGGPVGIVVGATVPAAPTETLPVQAWVHGNVMNPDSKFSKMVRLTAFCSMRAVSSSIAPNQFMLSGSIPNMVVKMVNAAT